MPRKHTLADRPSAQIKLLALGTGLSVTSFLVPSAQAASATWSATPTNGNWEAAAGETNWGSGAATWPGAIGSLTNTDVATFLTSSTTSVAINSTAGNTSALNLGGITFGASGATPSAFTIGGTSGNALHLSSGGTIQIAGGVTGGVTQTINAPLVLHPAGASTAGTYTFNNVPTVANTALVFNGAISGGTTTQGVTLNLTSSSGGGANLLNGIVGNGGAAGGLSISKGGSGAWTLANANTYSGATTIDRGTLTLSATGSSANSAFTVGTVGNPSGGNSALIITPGSAGPVTRGASLTLNGQAVNTSTGRLLQMSGVASSTTDAFTGALTLGSGGAFVQANSNASSVTTLSFGSLARNSGTTLNILNATSSGSVGGSGASNTFKITFGTAPTTTATNGVQLFGSGAAGTASAPVLPFVLINTSGGSSFATHDGNGLRQLNLSTEMATLTASSFPAGQNARVTANTTLAENTTVNSLYSGSAAGGPNATLGLGGNTLTVASGGILSDTGNQGAAGNAGFTIGASQNDGVINFGANEGFLHVPGARLITVNSVIAGGGGLTLDLTFNGTGGHVVLNGSNTFTGLTRINGNTSGSLNARILNPLALQNSVLDYNNYGAGLLFGANAVNNVANTNVTAATFGGLQGAQALALTNSGAAGGGVALTLGGAGAGAVNATYTGILSGAGSLTKAGPGTQVLGGANTYSGGTTINGGILQFARKTAMPSTGAVVVNSGGTLAVNVGAGATDFTSGTSGVGTVGGLVSGSGGQGGSTVTWNSGATLGLDTSNATGGFTYGGSINTSGLGLNKLGSNTLTLSAANGYTGATTVSAGTLALGASGGIASSPVITIGPSGSSGAVLDVSAKSSFAFASGQTVKGVGAVNLGAGKTLTFANGSTLAPGNSIGTLSATGDVVLSSGSTTNIELGTPGTRATPGASDRLAVTGGLTLGGTLNLSDNAGANGDGFAGAGSYRIFTQTGAAGGSFATVNNAIAGTRAAVDTSAAGSVFVDVYNKAAAAATQTVNLGIVRVGPEFTSALTIANTAATNATYTETLGSAGFSGTSAGFVASGSATGIAGGSSGTGTLKVGLAAGLAAGSYSGGTTLALNTEAVNGSGLGAASIGTQTITIVGQVNEYAAPSFGNASGDATLGGSGTSYTVDFGTVAPGTGTLTVSFDLSNSLVNALYQDALKGSFDSLSATAAGFSFGSLDVSSLAAGGSQSISASFSLSGAMPGVHNGSLVFSGRSANASDPTGAALSDITLDFTINVSAVPEPSAYGAVLGVFGLAAALGRRRRRAG